MGKGDDGAPRHQKKFHSYDDFNRLTKITYPEATSGAGRLEENFTYDLAGNLSTKTDQAGRSTIFGYDSPDLLRRTGPKDDCLRFRQVVPRELASLSNTK